MRIPALVSAVLVAGLLVAGCGDDRASPPTTTATAAEDILAGSSTIVAAQSLAGAFGAIEKAFETEHPQVDLEISFDGSAKLAAALIQGAPADLFASADESNLEKVAAEGLTTGDPVVFAKNALQIVVAQGNPKGIKTLADLTEADVKLSLCGPAVPCGTYARQAFEKAGLATPPAGDQDSVKGIVAQVQLGEADAGIVYVTDVQAAEDVEAVDLAASAQVSAIYPASVLAGAKNPAVAQAFMEFLITTEAQDILVAYGFMLP
jgi:molybdate transport system substrate-binding protein